MNELWEALRPWAVWIGWLGFVGILLITLVTKQGEGGYDR